ncbi:MAG: glycosyltransferase family 2 protein [Lachnospiraceae bacterium]|nr:glycosyltransferase family 2 protein [Lachnospiraceae bacterium]
MKFPITPYKVKKGILYWKHFGTKEFFNRLMERMEPEEVPYGPWFEQHRAAKETLRKQRNHPIADGPLISIVVPAYRTPEKFLTELIRSVREQSYENFELVIADAGAKGSAETAEEGSVCSVTNAFAETDPRIRYVPLAENYGIAENTNRGMAAAKGEYIGFLDHDDLLEPNALYEIALQIVQKGADLLYTDEDKVNSGLTKYYQPHFKPGFNEDLLRSNNYITHFLVVKRELIDRAGVFNPEMDGAQDYDFIFRCTEKAECIVRVPGVLYHWRTHEASTADNPMSKQYAYDAGKRAIEAHLARIGQEGEVEALPDFGFYRVKYPADLSATVSVIIPNKDETEALRECLEALLDTGYRKLEIIIVENNSQKRETFEYYKKISSIREVRLVRWKKEFNYSAINNYGVRYATGDYILFLNNDVRGTISSDWLTELLGVCQRPDVGAVGAKLYYPDNRVQSAGIVIGIGGVAGSMFVDLPRGRSGYMHKASLMQDLSAVTAACMMVKREAFEKVGGFTEELAVAFNDVDLCLKIGKLGYRIVYDPFAELYHDESRTRGAEDTPKKARRFQSEIEYFRVHYLDLLKEGDPFYNPNLSLKKWNYSLRVQ